MLIFITGGIKSGKSIFAEKLASEQKKDVYYIATAIVTDDEMQERVKKHRIRRPSTWTTIEESYDFKKLSKLLPDEPTVVLIDCLTTFLTNRLWRDNPELFTEEKKIPVPDLLIQEME